MADKNVAIDMDLNGGQDLLDAWLPGAMADFANLGTEYTEVRVIYAGTNYDMTFQELVRRLTQSD